MLEPRNELPRIRDAAERLRPYIRRTPTVYSYTFSESSGAEVYLKLENLQRTGSFKVRGALNRVLVLPAEQRERGLIAASAGNHAQGVALAAKLVGVAATIVMPTATALIKIQRTEGYGATVVLHGENYDAAQRHAGQLARERGLTPIHPFDDPDVIAGQGTVGLEILEEVPELDAIVVPIGGGGLISGVALAVKAVAPKIRVIGVQARGASPMVQSFRAGHVVRVDKPDTIAEGIRVGNVGRLTYEVVRHCVDECIEVEESEILDAVVQTMEKSKVVAETAGVAGIAALIAGRVRDAKRVCAIVSGGNIDLNLLARIIESGLAHSGRTHSLALRLTDTPGQLARMLEVLTEQQCNILDIQHYRSGWRVPIGYVDVEVLVEVRRAGAGTQLDTALRERGYDVRASGG
jgi:threonine dehydratase